MTTGRDQMLVMENVNGAVNSPGLAWYSLVVASQAKIFGAMLSPESSVFVTGGGGWLVMAGVGAGPGCGVGFLQPANSANDNAVMAAATMLDFSESMTVFVTQPMVRDKSAQSTSRASFVPPAGRGRGGRRRAILPDQPPATIFTISRRSPARSWRWENSEGATASPLCSTTTLRGNRF